LFVFVSICFCFIEGHALTVVSFSAVQSTNDHHDRVTIRVRNIVLRNTGNVTFIPDLIVGTEQVGSSYQRSQAAALLLPGIFLIDLAPGLFYFLKFIAFRKYEEAPPSVESTPAGTDGDPIADDETTIQ
jgi:hypothetical protein